MFRLLKFLWQTALWTILSVLTALLIFVAMFLLYIESTLPDVKTLNDIQLQTPLRIFSRDGKLIAEYGTKRRIPVRLKDVPPLVIHAVLSVEDQRFFEHAGVDPIGILRATKRLVQTGTKTQGGSTITMQVARNFFLSPEKTYLRKIKEILLALKIDRELSKEKILELYLNKIFYGQRAYGIAAAAEVYYGKRLHELNLPEIAMLAGLPQAPTRLNPLYDPKAAIARRNHVLSRLYEGGHISQTAYQQALSAPEHARRHGRSIELLAPYVAETVREDLVKDLHEDAYTRGLNVYTTIDSRLQQQANEALISGLLNYERRHTYRGPEQRLPGHTVQDEAARLAALHTLPRIHGLVAAVVLESREEGIATQLQSGERVTLPWSEMAWLQKLMPDDGRGASRFREGLFQAGDVLRLRRDAQGWRLSQIPEVEGALVSLNPKDGAILAMVGGFSFDQNSFNRVTQAKRQAGSSFKPLLYAAALAKGLTLATMLNDAPLVIHLAEQDTLWRPQNAKKKFYGMTSLRDALVKSRNLVSIRVLQDIGIRHALDYLTLFGLDKKQLPRNLSLALGTASLSPLELTRAYAVLANGGYLIDPHLIARITTADGHLLYEAQYAQAAALESMAQVQTTGGQSQKLVPIAPQTIDPEVAFLITHTLQDAVARGTASKARVLERSDVGGKTGTTNDHMDAWFVGYNADNVTTVWVGYDTPKSLDEYAADLALPIWIEFMKTALAGTPLHTQPMPSGIISLRINPSTGTRASETSTHTRVEYFMKDHLPSEQNYIEDPEHYDDLGEVPADGSTDDHWEPIF